ncbi:hypothetical protein GCM10007049_18890 [Echinicola pacifica]|uniref:Uncharacterized protein n=1 Tax=Echinicola pacifica TaxID=346377 RepID=A0A918PZC7_9BACT|nr:hypothetical protein [Echinicola pacifica]GGZ26436.1 hypothetical protein GCM10007049_18890 [Echinicola pacifica]
MKRKLIHILLLTLYLCFNAGLSYSMHYCGEQFQKINVFSSQESCCDGEESMDDCCNDVSNHELNESNQNTSKLLSLQFIPKLLPLFQVAFSDFYQLFAIAEEEGHFYTFEEQSGPPAVPIYLRNQLLLI